MRIFREWIQRLKGTLLPARRDADLEHELLSHMEIAAEDKRRRGLDPADASRAARIQAGGASQAMDALRDQRGLPCLDDVARDVSHGLRTLRRTPVFTAVALLTLALGIGANTAIFSIVNGVILRPLDYPKPEQLMHLTTEFPALGLIASVLFGVQPTDVATMGTVIATITIVAAIACWLPAWRASRLDPNAVLRADEQGLRTCAASL